jgi:hypothetical protein
MEDVVFDLKDRCQESIITLDRLYPSIADPFKDVLDDELIGVGCMFLAPIQYLIDVNETLSLVSYKGHDCGFIKVHVRAFIGEVSSDASQISIDQEMSLRHFAGKKLLIRFNFQRVTNIPATANCNVFVQFKFYHHTITYRSLRHHGQTCSPRLDSIVTVEQDITYDFVEYLQRESLDMEVWGRRQIRSPFPREVPAHFVGEPESLLLVTRDKVRTTELCGMCVDCVITST